MAASLSCLLEGDGRNFDIFFFFNFFFKFISLCLSVIMGLRVAKEKERIQNRGVRSRLWSLAQAN